MDVKKIKRHTLKPKKGDEKRVPVDSGKDFKVPDHRVSPETHGWTEELCKHLDASATENLLLGQHEHETDMCRQ